MDRVMQAQLVARSEVIHCEAGMPSSRMHFALSQDFYINEWVWEARDGSRSGHTYCHLHCSVGKCVLPILMPLRSEALEVLCHRIRIHHKSFIKLRNGFCLGFSDCLC